MWRTRLALLALLLCAVPLGALRSQQDETGGVRALRLWLTAVERHVPGEPDEPAVIVASWYRRDLASLFPYIRAFFGVLKEGPGARRRSLSVDEMKVVRTVALASPGLRDPLRFAKRAAMLHADVVIFKLDQTSEVSARRRSATVRRPPDAGIPSRSYATGVDGRYEGDGEGEGHWDLARSVLDLVRPPEPDPDILLWYRAATAVMMSQLNLAEALPHIRQGLSLFPSDPGVQFSWACLHEAFASPRIQRIRQRVQASGGRVDVQDEDENLERAVRAYRRVLEIDKSHAEARVRLGRVLDQQDNPRDAAIFLRPRIEDPGSALLPYYRSLFLGAAETKLGDRPAAESAFREASRLFPAAQSPRLGLALLALGTGNRQSLGSILAPLRAPATSVARTDDPWWIYGYCEGRDVDAMVARLRRRIREAAR